MQRLRRFVGLLGVLAVMTAGLAAVVPAAAQDGSTLVVTSLSDVNSLDPAQGYDTVSWPTEMLVYRGLVTWDDAGKEIVPALAESVEVSDDGLTYTFTLREGVMFSNGRAITLEDVKYSFERLLGPTTGSPGSFIFDVIVGAPEFLDGSATELSGITIVDDSTITFTLSRPEWTFLQRMSLPFASIVAKEGVEAAGDQFGRQPLGAGPFILKSWESGVRLTFERNPYYYREGYPKVDNLIMDIGVEPSVMVLRVEAGETDTSLDSVSPSDYPRIAEDTALADRLIAGATPNIFYVGFNARETPFDDVNVRQALSIAIDRERVVQLLNGRPIAANGLFPPNLSGDNPDLPAIAYDPEAAKTMLAEAGYPDGLSTTLYATNDPTDQTVVQAVAQDWQSIGVTVEIVTMEFAQLIDIMYNDPGQIPVLYMSWWADYPDPSNFYQPLLNCTSSNNIGGYCNPALDEQETAAALIPPGDERWAAYAALEAAVTADAPWAFMFYSRNFYYRSERAGGLNSHPTFGLNFETATVS